MERSSGCTDTVTVCTKLRRNNGARVATGAVGAVADEPAAASFPDLVKQRVLGAVAVGAELVKNLAADVETLRADLAPSKALEPPAPPPASVDGGTGTGLGLLPQVSPVSASPPASPPDGKEIYLFS